MRRPTEEEYRALAQRAAAALLRLPGVHSVGIGGRMRAGQPTGELVIKVLVARKRPRGEVDPAGLIPGEFEGVPTDVEECPPFAPRAVPGKPAFTDLSQAYLQGDRDRERPVRGGTHLECKHASSAGTLGFLARVPADPKRIMAVTNHHVLFDAVAPTLGAPVGQPEPNDSCTKCCRGLIGTCVASHYDNDVDAALIQLDPELEWLAEIKEVGFVRGGHDLTTTEAQTQLYPIRMRGRTLGLVGGTLVSINTTGTMGGRNYTNGIVIKPNPDASVTSPVFFGDFGDSGSALVNDNNEVVGLYTGGPVAGAQAGFGMGFPIKDLIDKFKTADSITIEVAKATAMGQTQVVPKAAIAGPVGAGDQLPASVRRLQADLDRSERGRDLIAVWLRHSQELNRLVNGHRRVAAAWRRADGPSLFRLVVSAADDPSRPLPRELNGVGADQALDAFLAELDRHASPGLRADLARHRPLLHTLPGRSYEDIVRDLH